VGTACACQPYFAKWQEDLYYETSLRRIAMHIYFRTQTSLLRRILQLLRHRFCLWCTRALPLALLFSRLQKRALSHSGYSNSVCVCVCGVYLSVCLCMIHMCACALHGIVGAAWRVGVRILRIFTSPEHDVSYGMCTSDPFILLCTL
jgi:hypothetical protein